MANTKSTQHEIDLTGSLNLNRFKADIKPYEGFNERNAPYYGGCLSPLYIKDGGTIPDNTKFYRGHLYRLENGKVYKDNNVILDDSSSEKLVKHIDYDDSILDTLGFCDNGREFYVKQNGDSLVIRMGHENQVTYLENSRYDDSRFLVDYENQYVILILGATISGTLTVKTYVYDFQQNLLNIIPESITISSMSSMPWFNTKKKLVVSFSKNASYFLYNNNLIQFSYSSTSHTFRKVTSYSVTFENYSYVDDRDVPHEGATYTYTHNLGNDNITLNGHYGEGTSRVDFSETFTSFKNFAKSQYPYVMKVGLYEAGGFDFIVVKDHGYLQRPGDTPRRTNPVYLTFRGGGLGKSPTYSVTNLYNADEKCDTILDPITGSYGGSYGVEKAKDFMSLMKYEDYTNNGLGYITARTMLEPVQEDVGEVRKHEVTMYVSNESEVVYQRGGSLLQQVGTDTEKPLFIPAGRMKYEVYNGNFRILGTNNGIIQGVSYCENTNNPGSFIFDPYSKKGDVCPFYPGYIGTLLSSWGSIDDSKNVYTVCELKNANNTLLIRNHVTYYSADEKLWISYCVQSQLPDNFEIIEDYLVINSTSYYNCVNITNGRKDHWASDWNNRYFGLDEGYVGLLFRYSLQNCVFKYCDKYYDTKLIATAQNPNYLSRYISSATFPSDVVLCNNKKEYGIGGSSFIVPNGENSVEVYEDLKYVKNLNGSVTSVLMDTVYPGGETRYNIPLFFTANNSPYNLTTVNFGITTFLIMYYDNKPRYQYLASSIGDFYNTFVIQGQSYGIIDNKIYAIQYANNTIQSSNVILPLYGLQYIGATIYNAYFYSPTSKAIYQFGADNNLIIFAQADTFDKITGAEYIPNTGSIIIGVEEGTSKYTYVLNERFGIYRIKEIGAAIDAGWIEADNSILCIERSGSTLHGHYIYYEPLEGFVKKDIILDTSFYGAGSNVVSVNDCWYIRVTDPDHNAGEIKLAVSTLTDIGRQTETRTFPIKTKDWDELTDTVYIRFQPKLQRAVGVSLHIESPFKIGYIGVGATPETLQLNRGTI